ncbi:MAG TPA: hypothetical protein VNO50_15870 [Pyrinomonadaceae bacterium]|nr:hypothetical protein [Pyrinomonadaceae bacterium]
MKNRISLLAAALLILSTAAIVAGQTQPTTKTTTTTTATTTVQNPDGSYSVIEYPLKKETIVTLNPVALTKSKGVATILRDDNGTRIVLNLTEVPADVAAMNVYAVDDSGAVTALGPVVIANGTGKFSATTPLTKFMLITTPDETLTAYDPNAKIFFRSAVPEGFAVIPHTQHPVGEKVSATGTTVSAPVVVSTPAVVGAPAVVSTPAVAYTVPMLNIPAYEKGDDTKMKVNFSGALTGARANVFITPDKNGATKVNMRFHDLKDAPAGKVFTLWAVSPENNFVRLGQIVNTGGKNEAEIKSEISLPDFGLLVTMEDASATIVSPVGPSIGLVEIVRQP